MVTAARALLEGVFDYAGLFPPASLRMAEAGELYLGHLAGTESWIVDRFICPVGRLNELGRFLAEQTEDEPWSIAVTGTDISTVKDDLQAIETFEFADHVEISCYEVRAPEGISKSAMKALAQLDSDVYVEFPLDDQFSDRVSQLAESEIVGVKARLGGVTPDAFPTVTRVAEFIKLTSDLELPFKLTAGLHHPMRHLDPALGMMHGFLNCLLAAAFTAHFDLTTVEVGMILDEQDPMHFEFAEDRIMIGELDLEIEDILSFRMLLGGIGSCSITEPYEGLSGIGPGAAKIFS
ncbi:MAG: hypothetical protein JNJ45_00795 [Chthonomonas sp.]|nr:hypothetical protein [Chthonomonas sp.]